MVLVADLLIWQHTDIKNAAITTPAHRDPATGYAVSEAEVIRARLDFYQGNRGLAAASLGLPKRTLDHKCQKLELR